MPVRSDGMLFASDSVIVLGQIGYTSMLKQANEQTVFKCDASAKSTSFPHYWEHCVGSGHATLALRADYQRQLTRCSHELGFKHVRFHGLMDDDMGTLINHDQKLVYSFFNADQICDFLLSIGMKPFMELSFMPKAIASGDTTVFHYEGNVTPPKDYNQWRTLIEKLIGHWVKRYGIDEVKQWFFEVWNEPNLKAFWTGSQEDYFKLYEMTAKAIKGISAELKVGGPATANNEWVPEFLAFCKKNEVPADFITTHHYPTDAFGKPGDDTVAQLAASRRSVLREEASKVKEQARDLPVYYTEWASSSNPFDEMHDQPYAAAFVAKTVMEAQGLVKGYSYWIFSDIFEENYFSSIPYHGGFGLMNIYGVPKPAYRAYELLHHLGEEIISVEGSHPTLDVWVTRAGKKLKILITNSQLPKHPVKTETLRLEIRNFKAKHAHVERIDDEHANSRRAWEQLGSPSTLSKQEVEVLEEASHLIAEPIQLIQQGEHVSFEIALPPQGTACVTIEG